MASLRDASEAPSSSSSDFYAADSPSPELPTAVHTGADAGAAVARAQSLRNAPEPAIAAPPAHANGEAAVDGQNLDEDDSGSEMDCSSSSAPPSPGTQSIPVVHASVVALNHAGAKRKLSDTIEIGTPTDLTSVEDPAKKRKLVMSALPVDPPGTPPRTARLPAEVWQRVFMHLSPAMLCRCLRVCKPFNLYLTHLAGAPMSRTFKKRDQTTARVVDSESIWVHSRRTYFTTMPRPLAAFSELDMLKLVGGRTCQFCARTPVPTAATSLFNAGPGPNGLRVIWPFGIRTCGSCLEVRILKDIQVLSDASLSQLRLGIPYGFRSPELHFVTDSVRQMPGGIPGNLRFAKVYYIPDLEAIKAEEENAKTLGEGAADEWRKGLATQGKDAMADCARWEQWELNMRPGADLSQVLREYDISSFPRYLGETHGRSAGLSTGQFQPAIVANGTHPLPQPVHVFHSAHSGFPAQFQPQSQPQSHPQPQPQPQQHQLPFPQHHRPTRNLQEVEEARQARKAEIERRCRELEPPLESNVLQHMESFQAAMQIATPMTDAAWNMLKPRILDQRERAEYIEHDRASQLAALQAAMPSSMLADYIPKPAKETYDREYEQSQDPLRKRLGEYATDYINGQWGGGKMLENENSPIFAAQVLLHVYKRYIEDKQLGLLPKLEQTPRKTNARQGTPTQEPFLSLDNMKFVYDNKVRPLTDPLRREQFLCSGCTEEKKPKWFAFEGLIQHYGAKHTTAFSRGNIVVHWQTSDWPEEAPFHTNPGHWLKQDRRVSAHNRTRNTPQGNNDTSLQNYKSNDVPYTGSNGHKQTGDLVYQALQLPQADSNGYHYSAEAESQPSQNYDQQVDKLSLDAREAWDAMDGVKDLLECVRVHTAIHYGAERFKEAYHRGPTLDMLTEAVTTNALTRPLKNAHGLACKSCVGAPSSGVPSNGSYWTRIRSAKLYNTSSLLTHFKLMHQVQDFGQLDWTTDMIELPDKDMIRDLLRTPGMNDNKLKLVASAFPGVFPQPLPTIGVINTPSEARSDDAPASRLLNRLGKKQKNQNQPKKKGQKKANGSSVDRDSSQDPLPEPTEDEYDPRRPLFVRTQKQSFDPAQFDTDARKVVDPSQFDTDVRKATEPQVATAAANSFNLAPETLAALQSLTAMTSQPAPSRPSDRYSRSPSVGRPTPSSGPRIAPGLPATASTGQPDIAAILASLTGQTPSAQNGYAPPAAAISVGSPLRHINSEVYNKPPFEEVRRPVSRYSGLHQPPQLDPAVARDAHSLQTALSANARQFEQNQHQTYLEAPQAAPTQLPPRYQYVYEGEHHYGQPPSRAPIYREAAVQYVQRPDSEHVPVGYQYERPAPQPIYVDQYGRPLELIPIDSAPAQLQYAPTSYEPQQHDRRAEQPVYPTMAHAVHMQPVHDDRRPVYYEQVPPNYTAWNEKARASVPRS